MAVDSLIKIHESKLPGDVPTSEARSNLRTGRDKVDHYMIQKDEHTCLVLPLAPITTWQIHRILKTRIESPLASK